MSITIDPSSLYFKHVVPEGGKEDEVVLEAGYTEKGGTPWLKRDINIHVHIQRNCTCDVEVLDYQWELTVKLSSLFKRDVFPANYSQIPKVEVPQEWENLRPIAYVIWSWCSDLTAYWK